MLDAGDVRGVLFDAGGALIRPVGGRWNSRFDFEEIVLAHHPGTPVELFPEAFTAGQRVLDAGKTTVKRADYHRAMLWVLGIDGPSMALLQELEAPAAIHLGYRGVALVRDTGPPAAPCRGFGPFRRARGLRRRRRPTHAAHSAAGPDGLVARSSARRRHERG